MQIEYPSASLIQNVKYFACLSYDMNIHSANSIVGNNMSAPIYWRKHIHILNRRGGSNLQDEFSVYMASPN
jgi:hypothetical protein